MKFHLVLPFLAILVSAPLALGTPPTLPPRVVFFPTGLQFTPLKGIVQEPRIGVFKFTDASDMRVDIGNAVDVVEWQGPAEFWSLRAGIDFFAYAYVRGSQGLRLQIDALDGFFGGHVTASRWFKDNGLLQIRLRLLHHSAHLADGHYENGVPSNMISPIPFTRDFGELTIAHLITGSSLRVRYYSGVSYATLVRPMEIRRLAGIAGAELSKSVTSFQDRPVNLFVAYGMTLTGTPEYAATNQLQAGIKFGEWYEKGATLYLSYYNGRHMFGEYYNERMTTLGMGFTIDFF